LSVGIDIAETSSAAKEIRATLLLSSVGWIPLVRPRVVLLSGFQWLYNEWFPCAAIANSLVRHLQLYGVCRCSLILAWERKLGRHLVVIVVIHCT
jgi:hypothetical protein